MLEFPLKCMKFSAPFVIVITSKIKLKTQSLAKTASRQNAWLYPLLLRYDIDKPDLKIG